MLCSTIAFFEVAVKEKVVEAVELYVLLLLFVGVSGSGVEFQAFDKRQIVSVRGQLAVFEVPLCTVASDRGVPSGKVVEVVKLYVLLLLCVGVSGSGVEFQAVDRRQIVSVRGQFALFEVPLCTVAPDRGVPSGKVVEVVKLYILLLLCVGVSGSGEEFQAVGRRQIVSVKGWLAVFEVLLCNIASDRGVHIGKAIEAVELYVLLLLCVGVGGSGEEF